MIAVADSSTLITMTRFPRPGCWLRFTPTDWYFIRDTLAPSQRGKRAFTSILDDPDAIPLILDNDHLFDAAIQSNRAPTLSPELFFFIVARHSLKRLGLHEMAVAEYIATVCADFGCGPTKGPSDINRDIDSIYSVDYLEAIEGASPHDQFFLHVQCANQYLVLTSLYPDFINRRAELRGAPDVEYYEQVVINHLKAAQSHRLADEFDLVETFEQVAASFTKARRAMNHTVREYLSLGQ